MSDDDNDDGFVEENQKNEGEEDVNIKMEDNIHSTSIRAQITNKRKSHL